MNVVQTVIDKITHDYVLTAIDNFVGSLIEVEK